MFNRQVVDQKTALPVRERIQIDTKESKQIWERVWFKGGESLRAPAPRDPAIPPPRALKGERPATGLLSWTSQRGRRLEALSATHKEKEKVKEDYKKKKKRRRSWLKKEDGLASGRALRVGHSGQRQAGSSQWDISTAPSTPECLQELLVTGRSASLPTGNQCVKHQEDKRFQPRRTRL